MGFQLGPQESSFLCLSHWAIRCDQTGLSVINPKNWSCNEQEKVSGIF